jgi:hypothetical protein
MAHRSKNPVMLRGVQRFDLRAGRFPQCAHGGNGLSARAGHGCEHHAAAAIEVGARSTGAALL